MAWSDLKRKYVGLELAKMLMEEYLKLGSHDKIARKYDINRETITSYFHRNKDEIEKRYPQLYEDYKTLTLLTRGGSVKRGNFTKKNKEAIKRWEDLKAKYKGFDRALFVIQEIDRLGGRKAFLEQYKVDSANISKLVTLNKKELEKRNPNELAKYKAYCKENLGRKSSGAPKCNIFRSNIFKELEDEVSEEKFLDFILNYNTGELSTEQLIKMANAKGVKVYELLNDGSKRIIKC